MNATNQLRSILEGCFKLLGPSGLVIGSYLSATEAQRKALEYTQTLGFTPSIVFTGE